MSAIHFNLKRLFLFTTIMMLRNKKCGNMLFNFERDNIHNIVKMHLFPLLHSSEKCYSLLFL